MWPWVLINCCLNTGFYHLYRVLNRDGMIGIIEKLSININILDAL
jgi:hypothetical protein